MLINKIVGFFKSLKLTAALLAFAIVLVFVGTIAQADEGLYVAQAHYFRQWIVVGTNFFGHHLPILLPGGYLIGTLLLVNLVVAHIYRFKFTTEKLGIQLAHAGVILILVGQLATDMLARELQMNFVEGETRNFSDSTSEYELNFVSGTEVTAIPARLLHPGDEITTAKTGLPFSIRVKSFWKNSDVNFRAPMMQNGPTVASSGVALKFDFTKAAEVKTTDQKNVPTAIVELIGPGGSLGSWAVSDWTTDGQVIQDLQRYYTKQLGAGMAQQIIAQLSVPQSVDVNGKQFSFLVRPARVIQPYSLTLLQATHTVYPGTDIPKDFRSRVRIDNAQTGEKREVEISMNHPLRYGGYTYYQYQMTQGEMRPGEQNFSALQVVRNPSWLTPYIGCAMVGLGLVIQFMYHLVGFVSKRKAK